MLCAADAQKASTPAEALNARDADLMAHFDSSIGRLLSQNGDRGMDSRDKLMALTREVGHACVSKTAADLS